MSVQPTVIRRSEARRIETPAAVMTTLASPSQGGAGRALWRVDMRAGMQGPPHVIDTEQVWTVLGGTASVEVAGETSIVTAGDTVVLPGGLPRRVNATGEEDFSAIVTGAAGARAATADGTDRGVPPWTS